MTLVVHFCAAPMARNLPATDTLVSLFREMFVWFMREWNRPAKAEGGDDAGAEAERPEPEDG